MFEYQLWFLPLTTRPCLDSLTKPSVLNFRKSLSLQRSSFILDFYTPFSLYNAPVPDYFWTPKPILTLLESSESPDCTWNTWTRVWGRCSTWGEANIQTPLGSGEVVQDTVWHDNNHNNRYESPWVWVWVQYEIPAGLPIQLPSPVISPHAWRRVHTGFSSFSSSHPQKCHVTTWKQYGWIGWTVQICLYYHWTFPAWPL